MIETVCMHDMMNNEWSELWSTAEWIRPKREKLHGCWSIMISAYSCAIEQEHFCDVWNVIRDKHRSLMSQWMCRVVIMVECNLMAWILYVWRDYIIGAYGNFIPLTKFHFVWALELQRFCLSPKINNNKQKLQVIEPHADCFVFEWCTLSNLP